ncbi:hypothetical protein [Caulobacter sp. LARHSG274]
MLERIEERLQDLERLVIKQAERIDELEQQLSVMRRVSRYAVPPESTKEDEAA